MNISSVSNTVRTFPKNFINSNKNVEKNPSFKAIYLEDTTDVGNLKDGIFPARFRKEDALLLNKIAQAYPNQDCFIRKGLGSKPRLEYREKPPQVQVFSSTLFDQYKVDIDPNDKDYPCVPLIIPPVGEDDANLNFIIGVPSSISTNPSLPYTVKLGFELHKKLLEKKYQIMDVIGRTDTVDFGDESITEKAHKAIEDVEIAIKRFLVDSAYVALTDRATGRQIYESNIPRAQTRLDAERRFDLTTSVAKQKNITEAENFAKVRSMVQNALDNGMSSLKAPDSQVDICDYVMQHYPNTAENRKRIKEVTQYMIDNGITLEDVDDLRG